LLTDLAGSLRAVSGPDRRLRGVGMRRHSGSRAFRPSPQNIRDGLRGVVPKNRGSA